MKKNYFKYIIFIAICLITGTCPVMGGPVPENLTLVPETINIGTFFSGEQLTISGQIPSDTDIVIEIAGHESKNEYDLKGRKGGLWMTTGQIHIDKVPQLYILLLPEGKDWEQKVDSLGLGMIQLKSRMETAATGKMPPDIFDMFIKFKKSQSLYDEIFNATVYSPAGNDKKQFTARCRLPSSISAGSYTIKATIISQNEVKKNITKKIEVQEVGFIKLVDRMASDHRITYGVSAVVIALLAGLLMGIVFKQSGGSH